MRLRPILVCFAICAKGVAIADDGLSKFDAKITAEDRSHWAFQPVRRPVVPEVKNASWCRNPIDRFVLEKLEAKGWKPARSPEPLALLRRVYIDLIGLPPTPAEQAAFLADSSPDALDRVVDSLLARPQYGERWARQWLDLARFAESNGFERDAAKPFAWKYRDWVIRAFNSDMPYTRFVTEQIAGDEIAESNADSLIATGFHRLGPWDDEPADPKQDRFDQLDDMVATTSEVFLGLTLGCARCHNHKFEPLTALDYTRMVAVFAPLRRPRDGRVELDLPAGSPAQIQKQTERDRRVGGMRKEIEKLRGETQKQILSEENNHFAAAVRDAFKVAPVFRNDGQKRLVDVNQKKLNELVSAALPTEARSAVDRIEGEIASALRETPDLPRGYFLYELPDSAPVTNLLNRGQATSPGPVVSPGFPAVLVATQPAFPSASSRTTNRRLQLAQWLTSGDHPLTARVIVNRVWQFNFGEGLVRTPSDFGTAGDPPTHPELLEWLADWFVHEGNWSIKKLNRLILTSNTSRMGKKSNPNYAAEDPSNELLWRLPYRRMEVEAIRDGILAISGQLNPDMYGPSMFPAVPKGALEGNSDPDKIWKASDEREASRRTIYAFVKRSMVVPLIEVLDFCDTTRSAPRRLNTNTAPQALALFNGDFVASQAENFADRLMREVGNDRVEQIRRAYSLALCRSAKPHEIDSWTKFLEREGNDREALVRMARVIFNLNEFAFVD